MVSQRPVSVVAWSARDHARAFTLVALVLAAAGVGLRVVGVPQVDLHTPLHHLGIMDPGCGGTRAMYLLFSGDVAGAALYNPVVFPLVLGVLVMLVRAASGWTTHRWLTVRLPGRARRVVAVTALVLLLALWVRQQAMAELLMQPWRP